MGTPWILTRLVKWRVRDLASCFLACRFPLEEDQQDAGCGQFQGHQLPIRNIVFETKDEHRSRKSNTKPSQKRGKKSHRRKENIDPLQTENGSSSWTLLKDEDYIVFCFKEDGANFNDVVRDAKLEGSNQLIDPPRPTKNPHIPTPKEKGDSQSFQVDLELYSSDVDKRSSKSVTSSDSSQSDASNASFSFPILGQEWLGSPAQMPKPAEDLFLRKDKICSSPFQCCRF